MKSHLFENTMSLLSGAGLGAALMYLFDPELGGQRRHDARDAAGQALSSTGEALHSTAHAAADSAKAFASKVSDYAHDLADQAAGETSNLGGRAAEFAAGAVNSARQAMNDSSRSASDYANGVAGRARGMRDDLADRAGSLWSRARRSSGMRESYPLAGATGITAGTIGVLALGAGLMYFMDPARGRGRRAWARAKVFSVSRRTGKRARSFGRHVGNQLKGVAAQARHAMPEGWSSESTETTSEPSMPSARGIDAAQI